MSVPTPDLSLDHISYATRDTDASIAAFRPLYPTIEVYRAFEPSQNVYYTYLSNEGRNHRIELVEPGGEGSPVDRLLSDQEVAAYHVSYRVREFEQAVTYLKASGYFMVSQPFTPVREPGLCVCHFFHPHVGLLEIMGPAARAGKEKNGDERERVARGTEEK